jgi:hypothetical protein
VLQKNKSLQKSVIDAEMPHKVRMYPYMNNLFKKKFLNHPIGTNGLYEYRLRRGYIKNAATWTFYFMQKRFTPAHQTL